MFLHLGGPDGEASAAMRYLSQRYAMPYKEGKAILTDIGVSLSKPATLSSLNNIHVMYLCSVVLQFSMTAYL